MATNLDLDGKLIDVAKKLGKHKSKKDAVNAALQEYVRRRRGIKLLDLIGTVQYDPAYDYKSARRR